MATKEQTDAAVDAVLLAAKDHGHIAEMYVTRQIATEIADAVIAAYEAMAPDAATDGKS